MGLAESPSTLEDIKIEQTKKVQTKENDQQAADEIDGRLVLPKQGADGASKSPHSHENYGEAQDEADGVF